MQIDEAQSTNRGTFYTAKSTGAVLCNSCHKEIKPKHAKFCLYCGTKVGDELRINFVQSGKVAGLPKIEGGLVAVGLFLFFATIFNITTIYDLFTYTTQRWDRNADLAKACFMFVLGLGVVYLFVRRNKFFPQAFFFITGYKAFIVVVFISQNRMYMTDSFLTSLYECILYFLVSIYLYTLKRTKLTFTQ